MKISDLWRTVANRLSQLRYQLPIALTLYCGVCGYAYARACEGGKVFDLKLTATLLGTIGGIMALIGSVSFAYVVFFLNQTNNRKHDLFFRLKTALFDFDRFLREYSNDHSLVNRAEAASYDLKTVKIDDFPLMDWNERVSEVVDEIEGFDDENPVVTVKGDADPYATNRILGYLAYFENIVSDIGVLCIAQVIAGRHIQMVAKALLSVALLLAVLTVIYFLPRPWLAPALYTAPMFFAAAAILLLIEVSNQLYREGREILAFVDWSDNKGGCKASRVE